MLLKTIAGWWPLFPKVDINTFCYLFSKEECCCSIYFMALYILDFPRVTIGQHNPLRIEEGDTAVLTCKVSWNIDI